MEIELNILIYGGTGYLGNFISKFLSEKNKVTVITRKNISLFKSKKNINYLNYKSDNNEIIKKIKISNLILIANGPSSSESKKNLYKYIKYFNDEIDKLKKFKNKSSKIIYFSSIHVYENFKLKPSSPKNILHSKTHYSIRNITCENILIKKFKRSPNEIQILRIANIFGIPSNSRINKRHQMFKLSINEFCLKVVNENRVEINSSINETRNFVSINDFINFIQISFVKKKIKFPTIINYAYNKTFTIKEIIKMIKKSSKKLLIKKPIFKYKNKLKKSKMNFYFDVKEIKKNRVNPVLSIENEIFKLIRELNIQN